MDEVELGKPVVVVSNPRTVANGTAGWHGTLVAQLVVVPEFDPNDPDPGDIVNGHLVALDEDACRVRLMQPGDLQPG
jgi:hypothetical protein